MGIENILAEGILEMDPAGGSALRSRGHRAGLWVGTPGAFLVFLGHSGSMGPAGKESLLPNICSPW